MKNCKHGKEDTKTDSTETENGHTNTTKTTESTGNTSEDTNTTGKLDKSETEDHTREQTTTFNEIKIPLVILLKRRITRATKTPKRITSNSLMVLTSTSQPLRYFF